MITGRRPEKYFLRVSAGDEGALGEQIARATAALAVADEAHRVRASVELAGLLTLARRETEAAEILEAARGQARAARGEGLGWLLLHLGTVRQYLDQPDEALALFDEALNLARESDLQVLESYVLHHAGRLHAELDQVEAARVAFAAALALRRTLGDPRAASSERALEMLASDDWRAAT